MELMIEYLTAKLNEEMKNVAKNYLTKATKNDTIDVSNEREDKRNE